MKIYYTKSIWKFILLAAAVLIFSASVVYTNIVVQKVEKEERTQAKLWAKSIQQKAELVKSTNELFETITTEEQKKAELWAKAIGEIEKITDPNQDITFIFEVIKNNTTIPVILTDTIGQIRSVKNIDEEIRSDPTHLNNELSEMKALYEPLKITVGGTVVNYLYYKDSKIFTSFKEAMNSTITNYIANDVINSANVPVIYLAGDTSTILAHNLDKMEEDLGSPEELLVILKSQMEPIIIELDEGKYHYIYYKESSLLIQFRYFPYLQFLIISVFLAIGYLVFSTSRRSEQNQVWVGMSKETAHQLGTPISSLLAWLEILKIQDNVDQSILSEINRDVNRLEMITYRLSKIGSAPVLTDVDLKKEVADSVDYLKERISKKVDFNLSSTEDSYSVKISPPLFSWVMENLCKNAVDAMSGTGVITFTMGKTGAYVYLDITDTGKGISKRKQKTVFQPGFTTKSRGWGLGLTLVKRIIEEYHMGKVFVKNSESNVGTTFRILLKPS
jgi:signal transduction histidine kinase